MRGLLLLVILAFAAGCRCGVQQGTEDAGPECVDLDGDGVDSCSDCDDADPTVFPSAAEMCDGKDNDCNGQVDDGAACDCVPGSSLKPCGRDASCVQACGDDGKLGACLPPGASSVDTQGDAANCGECGNACPTPVNASAVCRSGVCDRGPCNPGYFDIDRANTFGCEATCAGKVCTDGLGNQTTLTVPPLPETGAVFQSPSSGSSFGGEVQTSATHTNFGVLGEPPASGGAVESKNDFHRHLGGFTAGTKR